MQSGEFFRRTMGMIGRMLRLSSDLDMRRFDMGPAKISSYLLEIHRDNSARNEPFTVFDIYPDLRRICKEPDESLDIPSADSMLARLRAITAMQGGNDLT